jgi:hypothetical protein
MDTINITNEMKISTMICCQHFNENENVCYYNSENLFNDIMFFNEEYNIILITDFWGRKLIPAILHKVDGILEGRSDVWIPYGYDGDGGYSTRKKTEIKQFNLSDDIKNDVIKQWNDEIKRHN